MKTLFSFISCVLLTFSISSCKKEKAPDLYRYDKIKDNSIGVVTANFNGKPWESTITIASYVKGKEHLFSINAMVFVNKLQTEGLILDNININYKNASIFSKPKYALMSANNQAMKDSCNGMFSFDEEDAMIAGYHIYDDVPGGDRVIIDSYDAATDRVRGRFYFTAYIGDRSRLPLVGNLDTIRITDGNFDLNISRN